MEKSQRLTGEGIMPKTIPIFPLGGTILLPGGQLPLNIFEPRYLRMVDDVLGKARIVGMIQPRSPEVKTRNGIEPARLYNIGCAGRLTSFAEADDGRYLITLTGLRRFRLEEEVETDTPYRIATIDWDEFASDGALDPSIQAIDRERLLSAMEYYLDTEDLKTDWDAVEEAHTQALVASLAMGCPFASNEKQALLEAESTADRAQCLISLMEMSSVDDGKNTIVLQ